MGDAVTRDLGRIMSMGSCVNLPKGSMVLGMLTVGITGRCQKHGANLGTFGMTTLSVAGDNT